MVIKLYVGHPVAVADDQTKSDDDPERPANQPKSSALAQVMAPPGLLLLAWSQLALNDKWKAGISGTVAVLTAAATAFPSLKTRPTKRSLLGISIGCMIILAFSLVRLFSPERANIVAVNNVGIKPGASASFAITDIDDRKTVLLIIDANNNPNSGNDCAGGVQLRLSLESSGSTTFTETVSPGSKARLPLSGDMKSVTVEAEVQQSENLDSCLIDLNVRKAELS